MISFVEWDKEDDEKHNWGIISDLKMANRDKTNFGHIEEKHRVKYISGYRAEMFSVYDPDYKKIMPMISGINCHLS